MPAAGRVIQFINEIANNELEEVFRRWYPLFRIEAQAACPPGSYCSPLRCQGGRSAMQANGVAGVHDRYHAGNIELHDSVPGTASLAVITRARAKLQRDRFRPLIAGPQLGFTAR